MTEPYPEYMPEINSGRAEAGATAATWAAVSLLWDASFMEVEALGLISAVQSAGIAMTFQGLSAAKLAMTSPPFFAWLSAAGALALAHAQACLMVAQSYTDLETSIIPLLEVVQNRIEEHAAEASNVFGQNTPIIAALNAQYAEFWGQDGTSMMTYDTAVRLALTPKPLPPPPITSSLPATAASSAESMAEATALSAEGAATRGVMQAVSSNPLTQAAPAAGEAAAGSGGDMMGAMSGVMGAFSSLPSTFSSIPSTLLGPAQSMISPATSMLSQFAKPNMSGMDKMTGYMPVSNGFSSVGGSGGHGGLPMSHIGGGGGGGGTSLTSGGGMIGGGMSSGVASLVHSSALKGGTAMPVAAVGGGGGPSGGGGTGAGMGGAMMPHGQGGQGGRSGADRPVIESEDQGPAIYVKPDQDRLRNILA